MASVEKLHEYLDAIDATAALRDRAVGLLSLYQAFPEVTPEDFFVSEYPQEDGSRVFESLWLFTDRLMMEAKIPGEGDEQLDFVPLVHGVRHLVVQAKDYDLRTTSEASRMRVEAWVSDARVGELRASGSNCDRLRAVVARYLFPNLAPVAAG